MGEPIKVLLVSSSGGHLVQISRLYEQLPNYDFTLMTTAIKDQVPDVLESIPYRFLPEANQKTPLKVLAVMWCVYRQLRVLKPDVIVSTGAAPGVICIIIAKLLYKTKSVWIDSLANTKKMSLSGRLAKRFSDLWVSQWEDVAIESGASYLGKVI
jgi:UDP-N-acetylglucosamine:LPS N-acetylglucosamine transferase